MLAVRQEVDLCAVDEVVEEVHHEEEVDLVVTVEDAVASAAEEVHQEEEGSALEVVEVDLAEVPLGVASAAVAEGDTRQLCRWSTLRRLGTGTALWVHLRDDRTIPSVYEKGYVVFNFVPLLRLLI